jgi:putative transcriptional regulator
MPGSAKARVRPAGDDGGAEGPRGPHGPGGSGGGPDGAGTIDVRLDTLLTARGMTLTELAERVGITVVNLSILKNGRARAIRFSTLVSLCEVFGCQPGDLLSYRPDRPGAG